MAVSGGIDSAVLLHLLAGERKRWRIDLLVAHFNHRLRGAEADADEAFARQLAAEYGLPFEAGRADVGAIAASRGSGIEEAARALRYSFLEDLLGTHSCTRIATGHNADDNAETVLFHLFRGSGLRGLAGIPVSRNNGIIIRPLLFASRSEIAAYAEVSGGPVPRGRIERIGRSHTEHHPPPHSSRGARSDPAGRRAHCPAHIRSVA